MTEHPLAPRIAAGTALAVAAILFCIIIFSSGSDDGPASTANSKTEIYKVRSGDTLSGIASKKGVDLEVLQENNPQIDPQALLPGEKIRIP